MSKEFKEFNATVGLAGFDPEKSRPYESAKNALVTGKTTVFRDIEETGKWGKDDEKNDLMLPMVITDYDIKCNSPYIGSCMLVGDGIKLNTDMGVEFHCMHTPRSAKLAGVEKYDFLLNHKHPDTGAFPKINVIETLPVAIRRQDLIDHAYDETKKIYLQKLGAQLEDLTCEYVPSYKKSTYTSEGGVFSIKSSIVEIV